MKTLCELSNTAVYYMRRTGPYGPENYVMMESLKEWAEGRGLMNDDAVLYGIALDNPQTTDPHRCRFDVCIERPEGALALRPDDPVSTRMLPNGKFAVLTIKHTSEAVREFWASLQYILLQENLMMDTNRPIMERYPAKLVREGSCEFLIPVR